MKNQDLRKLNILITGATGFLGSHLTKKMVDEGFQVIILKRSTSSTWKIKDSLSKIKIYDIDKLPIRKAFIENDINLVIHTACNYGKNGESIIEIVNTNILFGLEILELCLEFNVNSFINTDTFFNTKTIKQKHLSTYSITKKHFVDWLLDLSKDIKIANLKLHHMYGENDSINKFIPWIISELFNRVDEINLSKGEQKRDFIYVEDVVSAYLTTVKMMHTFGNFTELNVGTGKKLTLKSFVLNLMQEFEIQVGQSPTKINFGSQPYRDGEIMDVFNDNSKLLELGWKPKYIAQKGIKKLISEYEV